MIEFLLSQMNEYLLSQMLIEFMDDCRTYPEKQNNENALFWSDCYNIISNKINLNKLPKPTVRAHNTGPAIEWSNYGIIIEIRFRRDIEPYAVVEDLKEEIPKFMGRLDAEWSQLQDAINLLANRTGSIKYYRLHNLNNLNKKEI